MAVIATICLLVTPISSLLALPFAYHLYYEVTIWISDISVLLSFSLRADVVGSVQPSADIRGRKEGR